MTREKTGYTLLVVIGTIAVLFFGFSSPIPQNEAYHNFSDTLTVFGIPNFWNVSSNLPILVVGLFGLARLRRMQKLNLQFSIFLIGISLVALGSAYYHYQPNSTSLIWDRLPMTIAFTALVSIVVSEFIDDRTGRVLLVPLLLLGLGSILYWVVMDDLRAYALVQFYPMMAVPIILTLFSSRGNGTRGYWYLLMAYVVAKIFEIYDSEVHDTIRVISGHSLKHIMVSIGIYLLLISHIQQHSQTT